MTKQQTIELLEKQMPSFYSLEQVIEIVKGVSEGSSSLSAEKLEELIEAINAAVKNELYRADADELVDYSSVEFTINSNYIELDSIDTDIKVDFEDEIRDVLTEFFEPKEEDIYTEDAIS